MQLVSVVITCHGEARDLPVMLGSLARQREYYTKPCPRTGVMVKWVAGPRCELPTQPVLTWDGAIWDGSFDPFSTAGSLPYRMSQMISVECKKEPRLESAGHHTRGPGIANATGDWIVLTNMDNYFVQGWRHRIEHALSQSYNGIVYWNVLNNLWAWSTHGGTKLRRNHADLSCCAVRSEIAKEVGFPWRNYDGDGDYIEACVAECHRLRLRTEYIDETLSVHN